jgi:crotonobetainyl-CoA:carnitine CoA-transferase CaiB-like acyl-CoA transferase
MQEFWDHEQLKARDRWREVGSSEGAVRAMKPPFNLDSFEPRMDEIPGARRAYARDPRRARLRQQRDRAAAGAARHLTGHARFWQ